MRRRGVYLDNCVFNQELANTRREDKEEKMRRRGLSA